MRALILVLLLSIIGCVKLFSQDTIYFQNPSFETYHFDQNIQLVPDSWEVCLNSPDIDNGTGPLFPYPAYSGSWWLGLGAYDTTVIESVSQQVGTIRANTPYYFKINYRCPDFSILSAPVQRFKIHLSNSNCSYEHLIYVSPPADTFWQELIVPFQTTQSYNTVSLSGAPSAPQLGFVHSYVCLDLLSPIYEGVYTGVNTGGLPRVQVYPNPAVEVLHIDNAEYSRAELYDLEGRNVGVFTGRSSQGIGIAYLPAGVYVLRLYDANGAVFFTDKVVKF